jgi:benzoyl-CoA-dihydrodiol lyase
VSSRSLYALIVPGSCFAGTLLELALAADRTYMFAASDDQPAATIMLSPVNFGALPMANGVARLPSRFALDAAIVANLRARMGQPLGAADAAELGLVTDALDELDWDDEIRQAIELRTTLSPDALTGMEANLRFGVVENVESRVFGRLSAWQNWIFIRPNAVGPTGALKVYGSGAKARFDWERV